MQDASTGRVGFRQTAAEIKVAVSVENAPHFRPPFAGAGTVIRPTEAVVTYWVHENGRVDTGVEVYGCKVKKDGTDSKVVASFHAGLNRDWPDWIHEMVDAFRPESFSTAMHWTARQAA